MERDLDTACLDGGVGSGVTFETSGGAEDLRFLDVPVDVGAWGSSKKLIIFLTSPAVFFASSN